VALADQLPGAAAANNDAAQAALNEVAKTLGRRGFFTTEWWTTIIGGALSAVLALVHVKGSGAEQAVAVLSPAVLAGLYAVTRTMHKSALAGALSDVFPQASQSAAAGQTEPASPPVAVAVTPAAAAAPPEAMPIAPAQTATAALALAATGEPGAVAAVPITQTDPDFAFRGIPPIADSDG
jgi:hypothetical protein